MPYSNIRLFDAMSDDAIVLSPKSADLESFGAVLTSLCNGLRGERLFQWPGVKIYCSLVPVTPPEIKPSPRARILGAETILEEVWWGYFYWGVRPSSAGGIIVLKQMGVNLPDDGKDMISTSLKNRPLFWVIARKQKQQVIDVAFEYVGNSEWTQAIQDELKSFMEDITQRLAQHYSCHRTKNNLTRAQRVRGCEMSLDINLSPAAATPIPLEGEAPFDAGELSDRQKEVANLVADGLTQSQIAAQLVIAVETVKTHKRHIAHRLGIEGGNLRNVLKQMGYGTGVR